MGRERDGEHPHGREAMDRMTKHLREQGVPYDRAREIARTAAIREAKGQGTRKKDPT